MTSKDVTEADIQSNIPLVGRKPDQISTTVNVGDVEFSEGKFVVIAGPCTIEGREMMLETGTSVKEAGASMIRGGAFKPLTFPYRNDKMFQLEEEGLKYLAESKQKTGLPVVTEILDVRDIELVAQYTDMMQVGARNMQNFPLLEELGKSGIPVLLKRHFGCGLRDWLGAAEYILYHGNPNVVLCERGITVPHTHQLTSRFIVDLEAVLAAKEWTHLPVIVDPSHATFKRAYVAPVARAALAIGADGIILDVHPVPEQAAVDPLQALGFEDFDNLMKQLRNIASVMEIEM
tara:strand:- start:480 stop:1349 length:870 start_codon:yes stop_codon:yes gene_type:complete